MINIAEKLKDAPKGFKLYSPICGECKLKNIDFATIAVETKDTLFFFNHYGQYCSNIGECILFPSKEVRGWDNFYIEEPKKKYKFKPFDKVVVRGTNYSYWKADIFSHMQKLGTGGILYECVGSICKYCLPYNEETAKLIGTTDYYEQL